MALYGCAEKPGQLGYFACRQVWVTLLAADVLIVHCLAHLGAKQRDSAEPHTGAGSAALHQMSLLIHCLQCHTASPCPLVQAFVQRHQLCPTDIAPAQMNTHQGISTTGQQACLQRCSCWQPWLTVLCPG